MLRLAADENLDGAIVRGVLRRKPNLDIVRIQDAGLSGNDDPTVLDWAAQAGRILVTHDVTTITHFAYERIRAGQLKTFYFWLNAALTVSTKVKLSICRYKTSV